MRTRRGRVGLAFACRLWRRPSDVSGGMKGMPLLKVVAVTFGAVALLSSGARAQTLEETLLVLVRAGAESAVTREEPGVIGVRDGVDWEVRVVDSVACTVRITDRAWRPTTEMQMSWSSSPTQMDNPAPKGQEFYLGRVVAADVKKVPLIRGTRNGVVVDQLQDALWRLPGSPGDNVMCWLGAKGDKSCSDSVDFSRLMGIDGLPDQAERTTRVDRAMTHLFGDLCKGALRRVPF